MRIYPSFNASNMRCKLFSLVYNTIVQTAEKYEKEHKTKQMRAESNCKLIKFPTKMYINKDSCCSAFCCLIKVTQMIDDIIQQINVHKNTND